MNALSAFSNAPQLYSCTPSAWCATLPLPMPVHPTFSTTNLVKHCITSNCMLVDLLHGARCPRCSQSVHLIICRHLSIQHCTTSNCTLVDLLHGVRCPRCPRSVHLIICCHKSIQHCITSNCTLVDLLHGARCPRCPRPVQRTCIPRAISSRQT